MRAHSEHTAQRRASLLLIGASLTATIGGFLFGFDTAVISGTISFVKRQFSLSTIEEGWFVSSALVGCIIGVSFAGSLSDRLGRKKVLILSSLLFLVSTFGCALSPTNFSLTLSRLVAGMGIGVASMLSPLYISEIAPAAHRGRLVAVYQFAITLGILCAYFSNAMVLDISQRVTFSDGVLKWLFADEIWRGMFATMTIPNILFLLLLLLIPESPRWLISKGYTQKAKSILERIQGRGARDAEYAAMVSTIQKEQVSLSQLFHSGLRTALLIGILIPIFSQISGINVIIYYGPEILNKAGFSISEALGGQVTIGIVNVLFTLLAMWQVDRWGRKPLLLFGIAGVVAALVAVGLFFFFHISQGVFLIVFFLFFIACFAFSLGPVTWIIVSEIFPTNIRGRAMSIGTFALWSANAIVGQLFPWMVENIGPAGTFWVFAGICFPAFFFVWKVLPETKGKTLEEIELCLQRNT
jgi:sugar porter (SP) family MFS transporter